jgi:rod shape-determining protein MreD
MIAQRIGLRIVAVLVAAVLQVTVMNRLPLPGGKPDLVLLVVIGFALVAGPQRGALLGFLGGFVVDVMPPAAHIAGRDAFAYTIVGYLAGLAENSEETSLLTTVAVVAAGSAGAVLFYAGLGGLLGDARITPSATLHAFIGTVLYDVVLAPFVVRPVAGVARRFEPVIIR